MDSNYGYYIHGMLGHTSIIADNCSDDAVQWLWHTFHECVRNNIQYAGFVLGLLSICCWVVVFLPQFYESYKNGKMDEGVSIAFLILWLLGDTTNLIGCLLADQLTTQVGTAYYYIFMDFLIISQYSYYFFKNRKLRNRSSNYYSPVNSQSGQVVFCIAMVMWFSSIFTSLPLQMEPAPTIGRLPGRTLLAHSECKVYLYDDTCLFFSNKDIIGYACGVLSSIFYLTSRTPQIYMNYKRKSVEGISRVMFLIAIMANLLYGTSVLFEVQGDTAVFMIRHLPWLVGSLGTLVFDLTVVIQFRFYKVETRSLPLLSDDTDPLPNGHFNESINSDII
ncbi:lysosomal amino acid transporter 1 homolog [Anneissia japonica]|uniref:lysosomal amino acid transporter 1 homolog n=1 Tax=Anneissia japonica TaxID=1529436 RepID=UPI001425B347|nr:lysosomal amino acid transporter 1 homolog [Anneissia japonica]XP_033096113.1 lysosomal amino acid transporter 1 homolog [Anneissia japonica]